MKKNIEELIEEGLKSEPVFQLKADFRDRVVRMIKKKEQKAQRRFYLLITAGVVLLLGAGAGILQYFGGAGSLSGYDQFIPYAVMFGGLVVLVQYLDKKLVKDKFFKQLA
ncbi:MAG: hypothetical protein RIM99_10570 [Cyclobacteriaceae bacterium]